jgi:hypothetical protein
MKEALAYLAYGTEAQPQMPYSNRKGEDKVYRQGV